MESRHRRAAVSRRRDARTVRSANAITAAITAVTVNQDARMNAAVLWALAAAAVTAPYWRLATATTATTANTAPASSDPASRPITGASFPGA